MITEYIRKDCEGNDVYLKLERCEWISTLINCRAYRKIIKKSWFKTYEEFEPIYKFGSHAWDKQCNWFIVTSEITESNKDEVLNRMFDIVMNQVNESVTKEKQHNNALNLIFNQ